MEASFLSFIIFTSISIFGQKFYMITSDKKTLNLIDFIYFSAGILFNPLLAGAIAAIGTFKGNFILLSKKRILYFAYKVLFAFLTITIFSLTYYALLNQASINNAKSLFYNIFSFYVALIVYILLDSLISNLYKIIYTKAPFEFLFNMSRTKFLTYVFIIGPLGLLTAHLFLLEPVSLVLFLPPLVVMHGSINNYSRLLLETRAMLEEIALTNDRREPHADYHSLRVALISGKIAYELKLKESLIDKIVNAGLVHDVGKISIPDKILVKKQLDEKEQNAIKEHPVVGSQLASTLKMSREEISFIRHHHERYDGNGYPNGLSGEEIPIGARIIAVAEAYETLLSRRTYKESFLKSEALKIIFENIGRQFDPKVVYALTRII